MRPPPLIEILADAPSPAELWTAFAVEPGCAFLDSSLPSAAARHSILACRPALTLRATNRTCTLTRADNSRETREDTDPIDLLRALLADHATPPLPGLPFSGAAIGTVGYEAGAARDKVYPNSPDDLGLPDLAFAFYDDFVVHDHLTGNTALVASTAAGLEALRVLVRSAPRPLPPSTVGLLRPDLTRDAYSRALARIRDYIAAGDTYQVNFTHRFTAPFSGSAAALHARLRALNPAPHSAYLDFGDFQLVSSTPERLLRVVGRRLETRPIKGTVPRLPDPVADAAQRAALLASAKDHAELLMIVDLARNDLGRVAEPGSVRVTARHDLETYATVHHLVATVEATLADGRDRFDALRALHPGGSITGAPKIRAMQIINELEPVRRHAYTGALGWFGYDGDADLAIAIRTITCTRGVATYHVGGGITWDSDPDSEYEETLHKGRALRQALNP
jgi:para-aminobenzoate synthetase component I